MTEKFGHIKNPLTIIAIFASIAEVFGTVVLPFIEAENQKIFIWFLITFPFFLVSIFFLTLNRNHKVLYAPSDFKDEKHFINLFQDATAAQQKIKLESEVQEIKNVSQKTEQHSVVQNPGNVNAVNKNQLMAEIDFAETLVTSRLSKSLSLNFKKNVKVINPRDGSEITYDAYARASSVDVHVVEIKLFKSGNLNADRFASILNKTEHLSTISVGEKLPNITLHLFAVIDGEKSKSEKFEQDINELCSKFTIKSKVHIAELKDLQLEYQYSS